MSLPKAIMLIGPTASGKTDLAIALARKFRGEVISIDSRQMYRGMDIGAATPAGHHVKRAGRRVFLVDGVPHHLLAFRSPAKPLSASEVKSRAMAIARAVLRRGRLPIFCGGTGLYADAISRNFVMPQVPPDMPRRVEMEKRSAASLFSELRSKDPAYAARIAPQNKRYMIRALEVMAATGRKFSEQQSVGEPVFDILKLGIKRPRPVLYARINRRVDAMMRNGLLAEAKRLGKLYGWQAQPLTSLGHRQLGQHLRGEITLSEAVELIKTDTRHYAKRQLTWFKRDKDIKWVGSAKKASGLVKKFLAK